MTVLSVLRRNRLPKVQPPYRDAFVLSGGGSLGAIQVGALQALLGAGIRPDVLVGCSVGALNATFVAIDPTPARMAELEALWLGLTRADIFAASKRSIAGHVVRRDTHLYEPDGLRDLVHRLVPAADLRDLAVPVHVVTTDLISGQPVWWESGDPRQVLVASASLPALFPPVDLAGSLHVDGGVACPVPVQHAVDLGAERIWVLDVTGGSLGRRDERMNALDVLLTSFAISRYRLAQFEIPDPPVRPVIPMPRVELGRHELRDFSRTPELIAIGREAGARMVQEEIARSGVPAPRAQQASLRA